MESQKTPKNNGFTLDGRRTKVTENVRINPFSSTINIHYEVNRDGQVKPGTISKRLPYNCSVLKEKTLTPDQISLAELPTWSYYPIFALAIKDHCFRCIKETPELFEQCNKRTLNEIIGGVNDKLSDIQRDVNKNRVIDPEERYVLNQHTNEYIKILTSLDAQVRNEY